MPGPPRCDCAFGKDPESGGFFPGGNGADRPLSGRSSVQRGTLFSAARSGSAMFAVSHRVPPPPTPRAHHTTRTSTYPMVKNPVKVVAAALCFTAHTDLQGQRLPIRAFLTGFRHPSLPPIRLLPGKYASASEWISVPHSGSPTHPVQLARYSCLEWLLSAVSHRVPPPHSHTTPQAHVGAPAAGRTSRSPGAERASEKDQRASHWPNPTPKCPPAPHLPPTHINENAWVV